MLLIVSFCGLMIYTNPNFIKSTKIEHNIDENENYTLGYVFGLMGTITTGLDIILLRKISTK